MNELLEINSVYNMDCLEGLKKLPNNYIDCCVTSPPYYGLRDYNVDGQIGLENTPEEYVSRLVEVFREVRRVLKPEGTLWLNLGDSYYGGGWKGSRADLTGTKQATNAGTLAGKNMKKDRPHPIIKTKDLVGIPWMVAFALRADGWYLRQDIIWAKPNPMPESVKDRCTKSHEYIFLLSKSAKYYYDYESIEEQANEKYSSRYNSAFHVGIKEISGGGRPKKTKNKAGMKKYTGKRNKRSVWTVAIKPYKGSHFATFPPSLIEPCILAGCPKDGVVLDPFMGSGTTALVSTKLGRNFIGFELNSEYIKLCDKRLTNVQLLIV